MNHQWIKLSYFKQELLVKVQRQSLLGFKNKTLLFQGRQSLHQYESIMAHQAGAYLP